MMKVSYIAGTKYDELKQIDDQYRYVYCCVPEGRGLQQTARAAARDPT